MKNITYDAVKIIGMPTDYSDTLLNFVKEYRHKVKDLQDITKWQRFTILRAVAPLVIKRKIRAVTQDNVRYFAINDKPLKNG